MDNILGYYPWTFWESLFLKKYRLFIFHFSRKKNCMKMSIQIEISTPGKQIIGRI